MNKRIAIMYLMAALPLSIAAIYFVSIDVGSSTRQISQAPKLVVSYPHAITSDSIDDVQAIVLAIFFRLSISPHDVKGYRYLVDFSGLSSWQR